MWRILSYVCFLLALVLFGVAGYLYFFDHEDRAGATIAEPERDLATVAVGSSDVTFKFHNPTRHTVRVVGCQGC